MSIDRAAASTMADDETLAICTIVRVLAAIVGGSALAMNGVSGGGQWMAIGAGAAFGVMAPARWGAAIAGTAAASVMALALPWTGSPDAALLVLPGAVVGTWLRRRPEPAHPVPWSDAMLLGAASEFVLVSSMGLALIPAALVAAPLAMLSVGVAVPVAILLLVVACGWMHVGFGRAIHGMLPGRFGAYALGQALPIALLALTGGEPAVLLVVALRAGLLWAGHLVAESGAVESGPPPRITVSPGRRRAATFRSRRG
ncbi:MAG TPA: hypothetical protein VFR81_14000 [Longimicrobium sp.]|nr:hypothetical protein [Longimicrobium sp.]